MFYFYISWEMTRTSQQECRGILELISEYCFFNSLIVCI